MGQPYVIEDDRNDDDGGERCENESHASDGKAERNRVSLKKPRFSSSPWTMLSVPNKDFIAAFALHSEVARPMRKVHPSVCEPFAVMRFSCSRTTSMARRAGTRLPDRDGRDGHRFGE